MVILCETLTDVVAKLYERACKSVPPDIQEALKKALQKESNALAGLQFKHMLENIKAAEEDDNVICQDNGIPCFFVKVGAKSGFYGDLIKAIKDGVRKLYEDPPYIMTYQLNPFTWEAGFSWNGMRTPFVYINLDSYIDYVEITAFPKGTGSSMWSKVQLFEPKKATLADIRRFVLKCVLDAGPRACPPYIIGVGIGGTADYAAYLAKEATLRPVNVRNPDPKIAVMEQEILDAVNSTGIGVMGLGGDTTAWAVNIEWASCHFYRTPMAFELNCWPGRRATARIYYDGKTEYL